MKTINSFCLKNTGWFIARIRVKSHSGATVTCGDIVKGTWRAVNLYRYGGLFKDGDIVWLEVDVVGGKDKKSNKKFIYREDSHAIANYAISGTTLINK